MAQRNNPMKIHYILVALCCATSAATAETTASSATPIAFLKGHDAQVQSVLAAAPSDTLPQALKDEIKEHINAAFDFPELSRLALGTHWEDRSPEEREHFVQTFSGIIREQNFDSFLRYYREGKISYQSAELEGAMAIVRAAIPLQRENVEIVYKLHQVQKAWRVYDLVIDGVSTAEGNRRRYARYIEKKGYEKLISQLDKQLDRLHQSRK